MTMAHNLNTDGTVGGSTDITIDNISFNVASMSSEEDGKVAFDAFINEFKKIGSQQGLNFTRNNK